MKKKLERSFSDSVNQHVNAAIDVSNLYSMKMLLFDLLPNRCLEKLEKSRLRCLKRSVKYRLIKDGEEKLDFDVDIVRVLRDHRWLMSGMKALLK